MCGTWSEALTADGSVIAGRTANAAGKTRMAVWDFATLEPTCTTTSLVSSGVSLVGASVTYGAPREGDLLGAELTEEGILLRPQKLINATQAGGSRVRNGRRGRARPALIWRLDGVALTPGPRW